MASAFLDWAVIESARWPFKQLVQIDLGLCYSCLSIVGVDSCLCSTCKAVRQSLVAYGCATFLLSCRYDAFWAGGGGRGRGRGRREEGVSGGWKSDSKSIVLNSVMLVSLFVSSKQTIKLLLLR